MTEKNFVDKYIEIFNKYHETQKLDKLNIKTMKILKSKIKCIYSSMSSELLEEKEVWYKDVLQRGYPKSIVGVIANMVQVSVSFISIFVAVFLTIIKDPITHSKLIDDFTRTLSIAFIVFLLISLGVGIGSYLTLSSKRYSLGITQLVLDVISEINEEKKCKVDLEETKPEKTHVDNCSEMIRISAFQLEESIKLNELISKLIKNEEFEVSVISTIEELTMKIQSINDESYNIRNIISDMRACIKNIKTSSSESSSNTNIELFNRVIRNLMNEFNKLEKLSSNIELLSLNASIEAAKAGREGRGFSVVAGKIKEFTESFNAINDEVKKIIIELNNVNKVI